MQKAIFDKKPQQITLTIVDGYEYYQIALNPKKVTVTEDEQTYTQYECDFHEFSVPEGYLDKDYILAHPKEFTDQESFNEDATNSKQASIPEIVVKNTEDIESLKADIDYLLMLNGEE